MTNLTERKYYQKRYCPFCGETLSGVSQEHTCANQPPIEGSKPNSQWEDKLR